MNDLKFPVLVVEDDPESLIQTGAPTLEVDGEPITFPTLGPWRVEMSKDGVTGVTITIPVKIEVRPKA